MAKKKNKGPEYPQIREEWNGQQFTIHGAVYERCSGKRDFFEFDIPDAERRKYESDNDFLDRMSLALSFKSYKKFPQKGQTIGKIRRILEDMWNGLEDPIKHLGCKAIKIHYINDKPGTYHWI